MVSSPASKLEENMRVQWFRQCCAFILLMSPALGAAQEPRCDRYAREAVEAQQKNLAQQCGLAGDPWSLHWENHRSWCLSVPQQTADAEANARRAHLGRCDACTGYAQAAVDAQQRNLNQGCGLTGDPWSLNFAGHKSWCMGAPPGAADGETARRNAEIDKCSACTVYAQTAVEAQQKNIQRSCGLSGDPWSLDFGGHRSWCMGSPASAAASETQARTASLAKCSQCETYAREAVDAQQKNVDNQCRQSGDRWSGNFVDHRSWCMGAPQSSIDAESLGRKSAIAACLGPCREYTLAALDAQRQNLARGCRYQDDRWSLDDAGHMSWCIGASEASRNAEASERKKLLAVCTASPNKIAACEAYAQRAIAQFDEDVKCGFRVRDDRRWHGNFQNHYQWCMSVNPGQPAAEIEARERELERCRGQRPPNPPPAGEHCSVSVTVKNDQCLNLDGSAADILQPGARSATGCGEDRDKASERAKLIFQSSGMCISEGDSPEPGCCTIEEEVRAGCLCQP
jgi:hypothetical protein